MNDCQQLIESSDILRVASQSRDVWKAPGIPQEQTKYNSLELKQFKDGRTQHHFDAFLRCMRRLPVSMWMSHPGFLDVGASTGYYGELLQIAKFRCEYRAVDYSPAFAQAAIDRYPGIHFEVADICNLPYKSGSFPIVNSGACIMHVYDWRKAIAELARVSSQFVILHRTPIESGYVSTYWQREAYGQRMLEIHFAEDELMDCFQRNNLYVEYSTDCFWDRRVNRGHRSYLLHK